MLVAQSTKLFRNDKIPEILAYQLHRLSWTIHYTSECYNHTCGAECINERHVATNRSPIWVETHCRAVGQPHSALIDGYKALHHIWHSPREVIESWVTLWYYRPSKEVSDGLLESLGSLTPMNALNRITTWDYRCPILIAESKLPDAVWRRYGGSTRSST